MDAGYILIVAILIVGGVIATVGDRIGTRVGKARLSLFNLRPKNTAVVVTIFTGGLISASTLGILFAADSGLRKGVFELDDIQRDLRRKREEVQRRKQELETTRGQKKQVETQLEEAKKEKATAQQDLQKINQFLKEAIKRQEQTQAQLNSTLRQKQQTQAQLQGTQSQLQQVETRYKQALAQLQSVYDERKALVAEIQQRQADRERLIKQAKLAIAEAAAAIKGRDKELANRQEGIEVRDRKIAQLDRLITERNLEVTAKEQVLAQKESRLKELETQQNYLEQQVARLEKFYQSYRDLRLGKLALFRGQVLAGGVIRASQAQEATSALNQLLQQANRNANIELTEPGSNPANTSLLYSSEQVEKLSKLLSDGREYVVRIFSAGNYVRGEKRIGIFADAARNQMVFSGGEVLAATTADSKTMTSYQLRQRLELLISASQFRARNAGILDNIQIDGTYIRFIAQLREYDQPVEIKAIAAEDIYTVGPLRVKLVAVQNGQIIFST